MRIGFIAQVNCSNAELIEGNVTVYGVKVSAGRGLNHVGSSTLTGYGLGVAVIAITEVHLDTHLAKSILTNGGSAHVVIYKLTGRLRDAVYGLKASVNRAVADGAVGVLLIILNKSYGSRRQGCRACNKLNALELPYTISRSPR